jgi:hypothetical protein
MTFRLVQTLREIKVLGGEQHFPRTQQFHIFPSKVTATLRYPWQTQFRWESHYCPVKSEGESLQALCGNGFRAKKGVSDLNGKLEIRKNSGNNIPGASHVYRQDAVRPTHGFSDMEDFPPHH